MAMQVEPRGLTLDVTETLVLCSGWVQRLP